MLHVFKILYIRCVIINNYMTFRCFIESFDIIVTCNAKLQLYGSVRYKVIGSIERNCIE